MPDSRTYVQGRYIDYYKSNKFKFTPLFGSEDKIEWGYNTRDSLVYRHLNSTEIESSTADLREHNGFGVYHSLTEYDNPSESNYNEKEILNTRISVKLRTVSSVPSEAEWAELIETAEETKSVLESEFPFDFTVLRGSINTVYLISGLIPCNKTSNLHSRVESYVSPNKSDSFNISSIQPSRDTSSSLSSSRPPSKLSKNVRSNVRNKYLSIREQAVAALNGEDILGYSSPDDEKFPEEIDEEFYELLDELQEIDGIASTKSFQFIQSLVNREENEIDGSYLVETTFNCKSVSQYYADHYISNSWLGDRDVVDISVVGLYGLIPCTGSLSTHGGFYVYSGNLSDMDHIPSEYFAEFYSENSIKISLTSEGVDIVSGTGLEEDLNLNTDMQQIAEDVGMFLLSSGLARKESEI